MIFIAYHINYSKQTLSYTFVSKKHTERVTGRMPPPGYTASPTSMTYPNVINVDLSNNPVNFADAEADGHRVQVQMAIQDLNLYFKWVRSVGSDRPVGYVTTIPDFKECLEVSFSDGFTDLDGISTGLTFTSGSIANSDNLSNSVNDLVMSYVLYKVYGRSTFNTDGKVYNAKDALHMLQNTDVSYAIGTSISSNNAKGQAIDTMFRDLLSSDPVRFFDASGHQVTGLFEINSDVSGNGSWNIVESDTIEIRLNFIFHAPVTRRGIRGKQGPIESISPTEVPFEQIIIQSGDTFPIRLQIKGTASRSARRIANLNSHSNTLTWTQSGGIITGYSGTLPSSVTIPSSVDGVSITGLADNLFMNATNITSVTVPSGVETIGTYVFCGCTNMTSTTLPSSVLSLGSHCFQGCSSLANLTLPSGLESIGGNTETFAGCTSLTSLVIPNSVTTIPQRSFQNCTGLTSISLPTSLTTLGSGSFSNCAALISITIPEGVTTIPQGIFANCASLTTVTFPESVTTLSSGMFTGCTALTTIEIKSESPPAGISYLITDISGSSASITLSESSDILEWNNTLDNEGYSGTINTVNFGLLVSFNASTYSGSGAWNDDSGNGNAATLQTGTAAKNADGNGIVFDGSTAWQFSDLEVMSNFSISVWYKRTGSGGQNACIVTDVQGPNNDLNMWLITGGQGATSEQVMGGFKPYNGYSGAPITLQLNIWHQITITWDGTNIKTYVDGLLQDTTDYSGTTLTSSGTSYKIGGTYSGESYIVGELSVLKIYNYALSSTDITNYYQETYNSYDIVKSVTLNPVTASTTQLSCSWTTTHDDDVYVQYYYTNSQTIPKTGGTPVGSLQTVASGTTTHTLSSPTITYDAAKYYFVGVKSISQGKEVRSHYYLVSFNASTYSGSGNWQDESGFDNHAVLQAGTATKNADGNGIVFDGSTNWIFTNFGLQPVFSMSTWFKKTGSCGGNSYIVGQIQGPPFNAVNMYLLINGLGATSDEAVGGFKPSNSKSGAPITLDTGLWNQITVTWDGSDLKTYVNGSLFDTTDYEGSVVYSSGNIYSIGGGLSGASYIVGEIGALQVYDYALSSNQITDYYEQTYNNYIGVSINTLVTTSTNLSSYWLTNSSPTSVTVKYYSTNSSTVPSTGGTQIGTSQSVSAGIRVNTLTPAVAPVSGTYYFVGVTPAGGSEIRSTTAVLMPYKLLVSFNASTYSGSGAWNDDSTYGRDATLAAGTAAKTSDGKGIVLDGSTIWTFPGIGFQTNFTMSVWFKRTADANYGGIVSSEAGPYSSVNMIIGGNPTTGIHGGYVQYFNHFGPSVEFPINEWHHIAVSRDSTNIYTYFDGSLYDTTNQNGNGPLNYDLPYRIGASFNNNFITGEIGALQIYGIVLSAQEISDYVSSTGSSYT
jgi:hypothetical protein